MSANLDAITQNLSTASTNLGVLQTDVTSLINKQGGVSEAQLQPLVDQSATLANTVAALDQQVKTALG